ncbi:hypothetical protein HK104_011022 [Borealophlyctis nickersoniae]|nr:hypothetical protein HK104_011022 [Borealophlyctis nickersoniae]
MDLSTTSDLRAIFFNNLLLLGFDPGAFSVIGRDVGVRFDKDMFARQSGNAKAMETVVRFLFARLNEKEANESREFRAVTVRWLESLKKEGHLPPDVQIRRSYFDDCRGERFERAILVLSNYVVKVVMARECPDFADVPVFEFDIGKRNSGLDEIHGQALKLRNIQMAQLFAKETQERLALQGTWSAYAQKLTAELKVVLQEKQELAKSRKEFEETLGQAQPPLDDLINERLEKMKCVRKMWGSVLGWVDEQSENTHMIEDVLANRANAFTIDGKAVELQIPAGVSTEIAKDVQQRSIVPYQGGKLDVVSVAKLWQLTQERVIKAVEEHIVEGPGMHGNLSALDEQLKEQERLLKSVRILKRQLQEQLADVQQSVNDKKKQLKEGWVGDDSETHEDHKEEAVEARQGVSNLKRDKFPQNLYSHLELAPQTPKWSLRSRQHAQEEHQPKSPPSTPTPLRTSGKSPRVDTPMAVAAISQSVHNKIRAKVERKAPAVAPVRKAVIQQSEEKPSALPIAEQKVPKTPRVSRLTAPTAASAAKMRTKGIVVNDDQQNGKEKGKADVTKPSWNASRSTAKGNTATATTRALPRAATEGKESRGRTPSARASSAAIQGGEGRPKAKATGNAFDVLCNQAMKQSALSVRSGCTKSSLQHWKIVEYVNDEDAENAAMKTPRPASKIKGVRKAASNADLAMSLDDPLGALDKQAFQPRAEISRTPLQKSNAVNRLDVGKTPRGLASAKNVKKAVRPLLHETPLRKKVTEARAPVPIAPMETPRPAAAPQEPVTPFVGLGDDDTEFVSSETPPEGFGFDDDDHASSDGEALWDGDGVDIGEIVKPPPGTPRGLALLEFEMELRARATPMKSPGGGVPEWLKAAAATAAAVEARTSPVRTPPLVKTPTKFETNYDDDDYFPPSVTPFRGCSTPARSLLDEEAPDFLSADESGIMGEKPSFLDDSIVVE